MISLDEQDVEDWLFWKHEAETDVPGGGADEVTTTLAILKGPRIPETAGHSFKCAYLRGTLVGGECLRRQTHRVKAGANSIDKSPRIPERLKYCASGVCGQGNEIRAKFPDWKPEERTRPDPSWATYVQTPTPRQELTEPLPPAVAKVDAITAAAVGYAEEIDEEEADVDEKVCKEEGCTLPLRSDNESGYCKVHSRKHQARVYRERLAAKRNGTPPATPPRRKILGRRARAAQRADAPPPSGSAPDDVEEILAKRLTYYRAEAERCERALKALRR